MTQDEVSSILSEHNAYLNDQLNQVESFAPVKRWLNGKWSKMTQPKSAVTRWDTGVSENLLKYVGSKSVESPKDFVSKDIRIDSLCILYSVIHLIRT